MLVFFHFRVRSGEIRSDGVKLGREGSPSQSRLFKKIKKSTFSSSEKIEEVKIYFFDAAGQMRSSEVKKYLQ